MSDEAPPAEVGREAVQVEDSETQNNDVESKTDDGGSPESSPTPASNGSEPAKAQPVAPAVVAKADASAAEDSAEIKAKDVAAQANDDETSDDPEGKDKKSKPKKELAPFGSLFRFADGCDIFMVILGVLGAIVSGGMLPAFSLLFGDLINGLNNPDPEQGATEIERIALIYLWVGLGMFAAGFLRVFGFSASARRQAYRFRLAYFRKMLRQDIGWHDQVEGKEFTSQLSTAVEKFEDALSVKFGDAISYLAAFLVGLAIGFYTNWKLTLVIVSVFPVAGGLSAMFGRVMAAAAAASARSYATAGGVAEESISSIRTVTALNAQADTYNMYSFFLNSAQKSGEKSALNGGLVFGSFNVFMYFAYALAFWYGTTLLIGEDDIQGGDVLTVFFCVLFGAVNIGQAGPATSAIQEAQAVAFTAFEVIDRTPPIDIEASAGSPVDADTTKGRIEFSNVEFTYPSRPDSKVLKGISFTVEPGTSLALVGGSGCGKSTCMALLQRFYSPESGFVTLDGVDIATLNLTSFRSLIGIVSQEPTLFATSILENIKLGAGLDETPTDEEVKDAAKSANIHDFIMSLPDGYDTSVGDQGIQLSGGQKQRVAIARALLRNPKILLLDEATSALDTRSERVVQAALDNLMAERTTIMIAHRLSTVKKATSIVVMESGNIIEQGSHSELAAREGGVYAELARLQALNEAEGKELHQKSFDPADKEVDKLVHSSKDADVATKEDSPEEAAAKKAAAVALQRSRQKRLMGLAFSNGCEIFQLVIACLMALANGSLLPIFSIIFTDILSIFFKCTPIPIANFSAFVYDCDTDDLTALLAGAPFDPATMACTTNLTTCQAELLAEGTEKSLLFIAIGVSAGVAIFLQTFLFGRIGTLLTKRLREESFKSILTQDIAFFDQTENSTGSLTTKLATDAAIVEAAVGKNIGMYAQNISTIVVALIISFNAGWQLTLLMLALLPFLIIGNVIRTKTRIGTTTAKEATSCETQAGQIVSESVRGVRTVASFSIQEKVLKLYDDLLKDAYTSAFGNGACSGASYGYSQFIMFGMYTASFYYAGFLIREGVYTAEGVMKVFFVLLMSAFSIGQALALNAEVARGQKAIPRIFDIIDRPSECDPTSPDGVVVEPPLSTGIKGRIEFRDVRFSYPSRKGEVLKGVSFVVEPGQTVALVGSSGSGKSTLFSLLERFYNLPLGGGQILIDDKPIEEYNIATLRAMFGVVEQEPRLFGTSIRNNVLLGLRPTEFGDAPIQNSTQPTDGDIEMASNTEQQQIDEALVAASAADFVSKLDAGLETHVGESGKSQMSGGQKQRIAIARALMRDAPIMLLDEATSALDSESEKLVQDALTRIMHERTTLVIAHRLSTIQDADMIIVLDHGEIIERGNHQSLLALDGKYAELCRDQSMATA